MRALRLFEICSRCGCEDALHHLSGERGNVFALCRMFSDTLTCLRWWHPCGEKESVRDCVHQRELGWAEIESRRGWAGPDMEQVKKEASKFLSGKKDERAIIDGVKVYSEKELEQEMG
jgi:hypothetical protein